MVGTVWTRNSYNVAEIRRAMQEQNKTASDLMREANVSRNQLYLMLKGEPTTEDTLSKILTVLGLGLTDVLLNT